MGWVKARVEDIPVVGPAINKATEVVSRIATAPFEKSGFNDLAEKFIDDPVQAISDDLAKFDDIVLQPATAPISKLGTQIDDKVNEVIPGGWATVAQIALSFAAPGLGTALGSAMLGAGASTFAAATLGGAVLGAGTGALTAALRGGDPLKGALAGAAGGAFGGAVSHASMDIAASIVGGGDQIAGLLTLKEMSAATGISTTQIANVVSNSVASGIAGAATGKGDVATLIGTSLAASGIGAYAGSVINGLDPGQLNSAVAAASSVANIGTRAALAGNDIGDAIVSQAPTLLANTVFSELKPVVSSATKAITDDISSLWGKEYKDLGYASDDGSVATTKPPLTPPDTLANEAYNKLNQDASDIYSNSIEPLKTAASTQYDELQKIARDVESTNKYIDAYTNSFDAQKKVIEDLQSGWIPRSQWENPNFGDPAYKYAKWDGKYWSYATTPANAVPPQERQKLFDIADDIKQMSESNKNLAATYEEKLSGYNSISKELETAQQNYDKTVADIYKTQEDSWAKQLAEETKPTTPTGPQVGDTSDAAPGTKVTLADGTIGVVSNSGKIVVEGTSSDLTPVVNKEPTGTVSIDGVVMEDANSPTGFSDDKGNPINKDGTPYLDPNEIDVAPDVEKTPEELYKFFIDEGMDAERAKVLSGFTPTEELPVIPGPDATTWTPPANAVQNPDGSYTVTNDDGSTNIYDKDGNPIGATETPPEVLPDPNEPPANTTPEAKYNFYISKGVPEPTARTKSGFTPPVKPITTPPITTPVTPVTPVKPVTPTAPPVQYNNNWAMLASLLGAPELAEQVYNKIPMRKGGLASLKPKKYGLASLTTQNRRSK
jgi:hypothetical protein